MVESDSYQKLIDHHKKWIFGIPGPELLHELFELMFTPDEAEFLSKIPFNGNSIGYKANYLSKKLNIPIDELTEKLDDFARRGVAHIETNLEIKPHTFFLFISSILTNLNFI